MDDNDRINNNTQNRLLDIYTLLLNNTLLNYSQTIDTIQQIEQGIRELVHNRPTINEYDRRSNVQNNNLADPIGETLYNMLFPNNTRTPNNPTTSNNARDNLNPYDRYNNDEYSRSRLYNRTNNTRTNVSSPRTSNHRTFNPRTSNPRTSNPRTSNPRTHATPLAGSTFSFPLFNNMNTDNLTPVIVRPTHQEIRNATEIISYSTELENTICPITQSSFEENHDIRRIKYCGHCFMNNSLMSWFSRSTICPLCRYDIREYTTSTIHQPTNL